MPRHASAAPGQDSAEDTSMADGDQSIETPAVVSRKRMSPAQSLQAAVNRNRVAGPVQTETPAAGLHRRTVGTPMTGAPTPSGSILRLGAKIRQLATNVSGVLAEHDARIATPAPKTTVQTTGCAATARAGRATSKLSLLPIPAFNANGASPRKSARVAQGGMAVPGALSERALAKRSMSLVKDGQIDVSSAGDTGSPSKKRAPSTKSGSTRSQSRSPTKNAVKSTPKNKG
jgi:hypothetical protein